MTCTCHSGKLYLHRPDCEGFTMPLELHPMPINVPAAQLDTICRRWREHAEHNGGRLHDGPRVNIAGVEIKINISWDQEDQIMVLGIEIDTAHSEIKSEEGITPMVIVVDGGVAWEQTG